MSKKNTDELPDFKDQVHSRSILQDPSPARRIVATAFRESASSNERPEYKVQARPVVEEHFAEAEALFVTAIPMADVINIADSQLSNDDEESLRPLSLRTDEESLRPLPLCMDEESLRPRPIRTDEESLQPDGESLRPLPLRMEEESLRPPPLGTAEESQRPLPLRKDTTVLRGQQEEAITRVIRCYLTYSLLCIAVLIVVGAVGVVCGTGNCSSRDSSKDDSAPHKIPGSLTLVPTAAPTATFSRVPSLNFTSAADEFAPGQPTNLVSTRAPTTAQPTSSGTTTVTLQSTSVALIRTEAPTAALTGGLTPEQPTFAANRAAAIATFINNITLTSNTLAYPPTNGTGSVAAAEEFALQWLIEEDPLNLTAFDHFRLQQRYALLTLWFRTSTSNSSWFVSTGWLTTEQECS
jgi:hypothetical protein